MSTDQNPHVPTEAHPSAPASPRPDVALLRIPEPPVIALDWPGTEPFNDENRYVVAFAPQPHRVHQTRRMVTAMLRHWRLEHLRDDAELVASELVTNAIQHAPDEHLITVTVALDERWLSIAVKDSSSGLPRVTETPDSHENGRGLLLVEHLADSWLCEAHADGTKTVSCRLLVQELHRSKPHIPQR